MLKKMCTAEATNANYRSRIRASEGNVAILVRRLMQAPRSSYLGLYDFSGFEGPKITIFLSALSGFEAQKKNFCDILVQLSGFEDKFGTMFAY
jgi:hypothetical protein